MDILPDIPRFYTALAEWAACMVYILFARRKVEGIKLGMLAVLALVVQAAFLILTGALSIVFWIPCMIIAVILMFLFLYTCCDISITDVGYYCIKAFVLAELVASLGWQIYCFFWPKNNALVWVRLLVLSLVYVTVLTFVGWLEKKYMPPNGQLKINQKELYSALTIGVVVFFVSNLSFVSIQTPFSGQYGAEISNIRTMVNIGGLAILYAHYIQCCELRVRKELQEMQHVFQSQYMQYQQSKESIDMINRKYHDFKHQIAVLRKEPDEGKRNEYLDELESDIKNYEAQNKTGNKVLDIVLTSKSLYCIKKRISLTCVVDGKLLDFMSDMDICSIFGNALENAIEYVEQLEEESKRLIHLTVSNKKEFVIIQVQNYFEGELQFEENMPITSKKDQEYHGYGMKSMLSVAQKYGGTMTTGVSKNWFELRILIPL